MSYQRVLDPEFASHLDGFDLELLDEDAGSIVGLWPDLRIGYVNGGWARFAEDNGGGNVLARWPLGASIASAIPPELRPFLDAALAAARPGGAPVEHIYECSSASELRLYLMRVHPLVGGGFLVTHSLVQARPHDRVASPAIEDLYRDTHGLIVQCCHCRRTRRAARPEQWDWVPAYVEALPAGVSHGLCPACAGYYYSAPRAHRVN